MKNYLLITIALFIFLAGCASPAEGTNQQAAASEPETADQTTTDYPTRNISVLIPFSAGGGTDVPGRFFTAEMEQLLGVNFVVSNVEGAGGTIGATQLSQAAADGYNLGFMPVGTTTTQPHLKNTSYGADSWAPICLVAQDPQYVAVLSDSEIKTIDDLIAKAQSDRVVTGGPPPGSLPHIGQAAVANAYGVTFDYLPHEGVPEVVKSMLGGRVDMVVALPDAVRNFELRPLAILASERSEEFPDVPTIHELGHEITSAVWFGFFAPAGTPEDVVETLSEACEKAVATDSFVENMAAANRNVRYMPRAEFTDFFASQFEQNGQMLKDTGVLDD